MIRFLFYSVPMSLSNLMPRKEEKILKQKTKLEKIFSSHQE